MVNFRLVSDLHIERFTNFTVSELKLRLCEESKDIDCLVLAGDIVDGLMINERPIVVYEFFEALSLTYPNIIYVLGNHEYYGLDLIDGQYEYTSFLKKLDNIKVISKAENIECCGVKILAATLWCNFNNSPLAEIMAQNKLNDFKLILNKGENLVANQYIKMYNDTIDFIEKSEEVDLMIFHYAPSLQSGNPNYQSSELDYAWLNNVPYHLLEKSSVVVHGHTHHKVNYMIGDVLVLATNQSDWIDFQIGGKNVQVL